MRMQRKFVLLLLILSCFILQGTVLKTLAIGSISPNLILILVISFGFMCGKNTGLWMGFWCGLILDLLCAELIGFYALVYMIIGFSAGCCCKLFYDDELRVPMVVTAAGDLIYGGLVYGMQFLLRGRTDFLYYMIRIIIPEMIYTVLLTVVMYKIFLKIHNKLTEQEMKERDSIWLRK